MQTSLRRLGALVAATLLAIAACSSAGSTAAPSSGATAAPSAALGGSVTIDGSSTVYPITEAVAEEFQKANPGVRVTVAFSGTGGGFKKFCSGETDLNDASRPIKADSADEGAGCKSRGIDPIEMQVAIDGLSVLVNPANNWVDCLTTAELRKIWDRDSAVKTWADVRAGWPADTIKLFGPGADSGTFDYFTEVINGKAKQSRSDYTQSEDDNALVTGIAGDKNALGYFGFAYYEENRNKLKVVPIDGGDGCVTPSLETIAAGSYTPLARPLYIYPSAQSLKKPAVAAFVKYYLDNVNIFVDDVGYIEAPASVLQESRDAYAAAMR